jgi:peroxiredoxin family protein/TusA-related sulfurtransferase
MQLKRGMDELTPGQHLSIRASDPGFAKDVAAWCRGTGNGLVSLDTTGRIIHAVVSKGNGLSEAAPAASGGKRKMTNVVFSNDLDRAMASFIIANGAAAAGHDVTLFFTFWGLSLLRKNPAPPVKKNIVERMFGMMLPKGPKGLKLSKMHLGGMGTMMMNQVMAQKNVEPLAALLRQAQENGVKLVACTMTMDVMGLRQEELIDGVELGGVAAYVDELAQSQSGLFI